MAKQTVTPATPWDANSSNPFADQSFQAGNRPTGGGSTPEARQFFIEITGTGGTLGVKPQDGSGILSGKDVFTGAAGTAEYTNDRTYLGATTIKTTAPTGSSGFGQFGGIYGFDGVGQANTLLSGDEFWNRTRILIPTGFAYNVNGRNKFQRVRVKHPTDVSEGFNDLYIDGGNATPWDWIFEGEAEWIFAGSQPDDALVPEEWASIETYLKFDHLKGSQGGDATVRVWFNDKLIIESFERRTMNQSDSYVSDCYLFTFWDNVPPLVAQTLYISQQLMSSTRPANTDAFGNYYHGVQGGNE